MDKVTIIFRMPLEEKIALWHVLIDERISLEEFFRQAAREKVAAAAQKSSQKEENHAALHP